MKNNTAILNTKTLKLRIKFKNEEFIVDMQDGDIEDNWNTIDLADGTSYDLNLYWEEESMRRPSLSLYGLVLDKNNLWNTNTLDAYGIKVLQKDCYKKEYFSNHKGSWINQIKNKLKL